MKRYLLAAACLGLTASLALGEALPTPKPGIHFLALDLPANLQESINHIQNDVKQRIKQQLPSAANHIHYHSPANRHISLLRFKHIAHGDMSVYREVVAAAVKQVKWGHDHHVFDLSSKVHGHRKLHVTHDGWITLHVDRSDTLTRFARAAQAAINKKRPHDPASTDLPDHAHISIARADPGVSIDKLRKVLEGHTYEVKCTRFEVHRIHLKHSVGHLHYKDDTTFKLPGQP